MRVRITKSLKGSVDGVQLSRLAEGKVYDLNTSLAWYLFFEEAAEPAIDESALPAEDHEVQQRSAGTRGASAGSRSTAADRRTLGTQTKRGEH